ncbi:MAG: ATP-binding protein [Chloroflexota bacterium]
MSSELNETTASKKRRRMSGLAIRLTLAFVAVTLISVAVLAYISGRVTAEQFSVYVNRGGQLRAAAAAPDFADHYARNGSWQGIEALVDEWAAGGQTSRGGQSRGSGQGWGNTFGGRLILTDTGGIVVADSAGQLNGTSLPQTTLSQGSPIVVAGETVGTLIITSGDPTPYGELEEQYLASVRRALLWAGLLAGGLGIGLGLLLAHQIIAPLRHLRAAARAIASGDLSRRVGVESDDEIGDLAHTFNHMATELQRQEALRRNMVADIAHELRTPLSVVRGNLEAMIDGVHPLDAAHVAPIYDETLLLQRLVDDLRLLSLADAGQLALDLQTVDVAGLIASTVEAASGMASSLAIPLTSQVPDDLPPVTGDAQRLRQVLNNLVSNALRHTANNGQVTISAQAADQEIEIAVTDNGPGITPEDLPHVFERFYRGDRSRARQSGGSGLGLAISRKLIEAHGGRMWVESSPGRGARFVFRLPTTARQWQ